ncbi:ankyrin repeat domain-containing protein [Legionella cincinnatiensis]|uniref:Ankyrin repeats (3 copies) n=1 Tax=Legionella cincinnatiensis TaxID=28085 RepID=A0A378IL80_9GAMM|nr:ankyrin repeat domain-containing protein [Legionella cincinnatiensis]KTC82100.1 Ankyrin repeats (3 copies) [Legionella cincinnatiensis]STX35425.1 Ankyrin repeats (3 copies) [Legionella cincinnatiensis]
MKTTDDKHSKRKEHQKDSLHTTEDATQQMVSEIVEYCRKGSKWGVRAILDTVKEQQRGFLLNQHDRFGDTALTAAASGGHNGLLQYLLEIPGVDPNITTEGTRFTPLILAAAHGNSQIVDNLIKLSAINPEIKDINQMTAAEEATYSGHLEISTMITNRKI